MGPRGVSIIERIAAQEIDPPVQLVLIDDAQIGAGRVWDTAQTHLLCMNTLAGAVTLFTEPGATVEAPVLEGPTMYEWIQAIRGESIPAPKAALVARYPISVDSSFTAEIAATRPESNPSRALYGAYIRWVYQVALGQLPDTVTVAEYNARALSIRQSPSAPNADVITLSDGQEITAHATVMATGWQRPQLEDNSEFGLWVAPDNPVEQDLSRIPAGEEVLVRGLGMGFFDVMALLSVGRGGRFIDDPHARSGLRYEPSGQEPKLAVTSGRGYPYLPKSEYHSLPPAATLSRLKSVVNALSGQSGIDFNAQVWPAIAADSFEAYYRTLHRVDPGAITGSIEELVAAIDTVCGPLGSTNRGVDAAGALPASTSVVDAVDLALEEAVAEFVPDPKDRFSLRMWKDPLAGLREDTTALTARIADALARDISAAVAARDSALKAGLWEVSAARKPAWILGSEGRYSYESRSDGFNAFMAFGGMVGSGPPLFRTRQLLALVDAGLVTFLGARPQLVANSEGFQITTATTGEPVSSPVLIDAWMRDPDVRTPADPLALSLGDRQRPFGEIAADGTAIPTASPEVVPSTRQLVRRDGTPDPRLHLVGIPTHAQLPDTTISPMPGTDPLMLQETDKVARHLIEVIGG
ncbi:FAD/NAD(P)-binding protein [Corynebacterium sp. SCR221107]|uniref:FAD/NAD(P)-binding protein n=1 Tax=Corynebacterium sp. SCR221107 TaxID=3017361 RepID=UPI0022EC4AF7|nr:FAD/NAD(P)-binding protein [Corynebacterium sp. SCR221107]WBT09452.1 FAD/NAD(P)-binding protein [Corynebacterium sp. SCR221107]